MPGLFGHSGMDNLTELQAHRRIEVRYGRRCQMQNGLFDLGIAIAGEWLTARQSFVTHDRQGKNIGNGGRRIHLDLFRRHVQQRSLQTRNRSLTAQVDHTEVD